MPNWVKNRITVHGDKTKVEMLKAFVKSEKKNDDGETTTNYFDFNKIVPMPEELNIESSSSGDWGMRYILLKSKHRISWTDDDNDFMKTMLKRETDNPKAFEKMIDLGKKYLSNISKYGYATWYQFCSSNDGWSTKWNSDCEDDWCGNSIEFNTAWSFPYNVIIQLSKMFPDISIEFEYADEDCGTNDGCGTIKNGEEIDCDYPDTGSNRAYEIYLSLYPEYENELVYNSEKDTYEWIENDFD